MTVPSHGWFINGIQTLDHRPLGSSRDGWQGCCRNALPHRLEVVVSRVELHPSLGNPAMKRSIWGMVIPPTQMEMLAMSFFWEVGFTP